MDADCGEVEGKVWTGHERGPWEPGRRHALGAHPMVSIAIRPDGSFKATRPRRGLHWRVGPRRLGWRHQV
jgi:hypothetical protein